MTAYVWAISGYALEQGNISSMKATDWFRILSELILSNNNKRIQIIVE